MMEYCRYCKSATAIDEFSAWCDYKRGKVGKTDRRYNCKGYEFNSIDAYCVFRGLTVDDPRAQYKPRGVSRVDENQITLFEVLE